MIPSILALSFILLIPLFIGMIIAFFLWQNRKSMEKNLAIIFLAGILLGESLYSATYSNELLLQDMSGYMLLVFFRYLGMLIFILSMICFAFWYVGKWNRQSKLLIALLCIPGLLTLIIIATNSYHRLFYPNILHITEGLPHFIHSNGIFYLPIQAFAICMLIFIVILLVYWMISSPRSYGPAIWFILIGALSPLIGTILYHLGVRPSGFINLIPFSLIITAIMFTIALVKFRLYAFKPIAYRSIFNALPAGILIVDEMNRIIEINSLITEYIQISEKAALNQSLDSLLSADHPVLQFLKTEESTSTEITIDEHYIHLKKTILHSSDGDFLGTLILFTDITGQKSAERAIEKSERILRSTFDSTRDGILITDQEHQIIASNDRCWEMWDLNKSFAHLTSEKEFINVTQTLIDNNLSSIDSIKPDDSDAPLVTVTLYLKNGKILERYTAPLIIRGAIAGRIWTFHDITEIKEKEQSLLESETKYKHLLDNAPDLIWQLDNLGNFTYVSPSWTRILGYPVEDVVGKNFRDLVHEDDRFHCEQYLSNSIQKTETRNGIEYRVRHADGSWHWHYGSLIISFNPDGEHISVIGTSRDITNLKIAEKSLKNANRQLNLLTSITRHDILNEVMIMYGYLDLARDIPKTPEIEKIFSVFAEVIPTIQSQIEFTSVFESLGSHEPQWQNIAAIFHKKRSPATIHIPDALGQYEIYADPMLERVFDNLLENSMRHGEHVKDIYLSCAESQNDLEIIYEDNGIGIPIEDKNRIFKRGYGKNTGMGLFLVREILQLTGISIYETGEYGKGVRFEILIPAESFRVK